jgi:hypothetical protein
VFLVFGVVLPIGASLLAWRNARLGRGDRRGASRLAGFGFLIILLEHLLRNNHVAASGEILVLITALSHALLVAATYWVLYMAFEPYVRRRSPETLISWGRLLAGRLQDPLVGADLLVGCILGIAAVFLYALAPLAVPFGRVFEPPQLPAGAGLSLAVWVWQLITAVVVGLSYVLFLNLLRFLVRQRWLAALVFMAIVPLIFLPAYVTAFPILAVLTGLAFGLLVYALTRFGLLTAIALIFVDSVLRTFPLTTHLSAWYARGALLAMLSVLALAIYAFHTTLAGRPLWRGELQEV